ncbi:hypothetical protein ABFX02_07G067700 [Erythranthe guttata]
MTRSNNQISYLFILTIITLIINKLPLAESEATLYEILIEDEFAPGSLPMNITCQAGGKSIAADSIRTGETMRFSYYFDTSHGAPYKVKCIFVIGIRTTSYVMFDYFRDAVGGRCKEEVCNWSGMEEGLYLYYDNLYRLIYPW